MRGPGAVIKAACLKIGDRGFVPRYGIQVLKKQDISSPLTRIYSILWGASLTERLRAYAAELVRQSIYYICSFVRSSFFSFIWNFMELYSCQNCQEVIRRKLSF